MEQSNKKKSSEGHAQFAAQSFVVLGELFVRDCQYSPLTIDNKSSLLSA